MDKRLQNGPYQQPTDRVCVCVCVKKKTLFLQKVASTTNSGEFSGFRTPEARLASPFDRGTWSRLQGKHTHTHTDEPQSHTSWRHIFRTSKEWQTHKFPVAATWVYFSTTHQPCRRECLWQWCQSLSHTPPGFSRMKRWWGTDRPARSSQATRYSPANGPHG